jgi:hypothetical protein
VKQITRIERRQSRIRRIDSRQQENPVVEDEQVDSCPEGHYAIGKTQNMPLDLTVFVQRYSGDPAIKVLQHNILRERS